MGLWGWLMMVAFWAIVIFGILWAIRTTTAPRQPDEDSALRILDERLARGEIDRDDYEERRQILQSGR
jgi:putative membrane protein